MHVPFQYITFTSLHITMLWGKGTALPVNLALSSYKISYIEWKNKDDSPISIVFVWLIILGYQITPESSSFEISPHSIRVCFSLYSLLSQNLSFSLPFIFKEILFDTDCLYFTFFIHLQSGCCSFSTKPVFLKDIKITPLSKCFWTGILSSHLDPDPS